MTSFRSLRLNMLRLSLIGSCKISDNMSFITQTAAKSAIGHYDQAELQHTSTWTANTTTCLGHAWGSDMKLSILVPRILIFRGLAPACRPRVSL